MENKVKKMAILVTANVKTRVVVDVPIPNGCLDDEAYKKAYEKALIVAKSRLLNNLDNDYMDCVEEVAEDNDMPYDPNYD